MPIDKDIGMIVCSSFLIVLLYRNGTLLHNMFGMKRNPKRTLVIPLFFRFILRPRFFLHVDGSYNHMMVFAN